MRLRTRLMIRRSLRTGVLVLASGSVVCACGRSGIAELPGSGSAFQERQVFLADLIGMSAPDASQLLLSGSSAQEAANPVISTSFASERDEASRAGDSAGWSVAALCSTRATYVDGGDNRPATVFMLIDKVGSGNPDLDREIEQWHSQVDQYCDPTLTSVTVRD